MAAVGVGSDVAEPAEVDPAVTRVDRELDEDPVPDDADRLDCGCPVDDCTHYDPFDLDREEDR